MKLGRPIDRLVHGQPVKCIVGSAKLGIRRNQIYTYFGFRNELLNWRNVGNKWFLRKVLNRGRSLVRTGRFITIDFCPKCARLWNPDHDCNRCNTEQL